MDSSPGIEPGYNSLGGYCVFHYATRRKFLWRPWRESSPHPLLCRQDTAPANRALKLVLTEGIEPSSDDYKSPALTVELRQGHNIVSHTAAFITYDTRVAIIWYRVKESNLCITIISRALYL